MTSPWQPKSSPWRKLLACAFLAALPVALALAQEQPLPPGQPPPGPPPPTEAKTVRVKAEGYNHDDALKQALRKALEQGAGVQISAHSQVQDYVLIRDTIYSRAAGIVKDYRILN